MPPTSGKLIPTTSASVSEAPSWALTPSETSCSSCRLGWPVNRSIGILPDRVGPADGPLAVEIDVEASGHVKRNHILGHCGQVQRAAEVQVTVKGLTAEVEGVVAGSEGNVTVLGDAEGKVRHARNALTSTYSDGSAGSTTIAPP